MYVVYFRKGRLTYIPCLTEKWWEKFSFVWVTWFPSSWECKHCLKKRFCKFETGGWQFGTFLRHLWTCDEPGDFFLVKSKQLWLLNFISLVTQRKSLVSKFLRFLRHYLEIPHGTVQVETTTHSAHHQITRMKWGQRPEQPPLSLHSSLRPKTSENTYFFCFIFQLLDLSRFFLLSKELRQQERLSLNQVMIDWSKFGTKSGTYMSVSTIYF